MSSKKFVFTIVTAVVILLIVGTIGLIYFLFYDTNEGKTYSSKEELCVQFAQSYLKTIPKVEPDFNDEKWQMAVDVETDFYNMCLLDLNKDALKNYNPHTIGKYKEN